MRSALWLAVAAALALIVPILGTSTSAFGAAASGSLVLTPAQANDALAKVNATVAKANATLSAKLLATVETGSALSADTQFYAANKKLGVPFPVEQISNTAVFVPRQSSWPAYFVAFDTQTDSQGGNSTQASLLQQSSKNASWKVVLYANGAGATVDVTLDSDGYATAAPVKGAAVAPHKLSQALCAHYAAPGSSSDLFVGGDDGGVSDLAQQVIAPAQAAAKAKGHRFVVRCVPQLTPVAALQADSGVFVIFSTLLTTTEIGSKANPVVVAPAPSGQFNNIPVGRYTSTAHTHIAMLAGDVQSPSAGSATPIDAVFGEVFAGPASGTSPVK